MRTFSQLSIPPISSLISESDFMKGPHSEPKDLLIFFGRSSQVFCWPAFHTWELSPWNPLPLNTAPWGLIWFELPPQKQAPGINFWSLAWNFLGGVHCFGRVFFLDFFFTHLGPKSIISQVPENSKIFSLVLCAIKFPTFCVSEMRKYCKLCLLAGSLANLQGHFLSPVLRVVRGGLKFGGVIFLLLIGFLLGWSMRGSCFGGSYWGEVTIVNQLDQNVKLKLQLSFNED